MATHYDHELYALNSGRVCEQEPIPLPSSKGLPLKLNTYDDVDEPVFDPKVHLNLQHPEYIRLLDDFEKTNAYPVVTDHKGSNFAYSAPFQVDVCLKGIYFRSTRTCEIHMHCRSLVMKALE